MIAADMRARWVSIAALSSVVAVAFGSMFYAYSVLITEDAAGGEFSTGLLSTAYGGSVLVGGGLAFLVGRWVDRAGIRPALFLGSALGGAGLVGLSVAGEPWQIVAASWALIGPASAMLYYEPAFVAVDQWFGSKRRARAIGVMTVIGGLAGPVFLPLTGFLVTGWGWRPTAAALGVGVWAIGWVIAATAIPRRIHVPAPDPQSDDPPAPRPRLAGDRRFLWFTVSTFLTYGALQAVFFHRIAIFEEDGAAVAVAATWAGIAGVLSFPGRYVMPALSSRWRATSLQAIALVAVSGSVALMLAGSAGWAMPAHFVAFGLAFGGTLPLRAVVMAEWFSGSGYGSAMGVQWSLAAVAGAGFPWIIGIARDAAGSYDPSVAVVAATLLAAALAALVAARAHAASDRSAK